MPILEFQHVSKVYNNTTKALDDLSFSVKEGEFLSARRPKRSVQTLQRRKGL